MEIMQLKSNIALRSALNKGKAESRAKKNATGKRLWSGREVEVSLGDRDI